MTGLHGKADDLINFLRGAAGVMSRISPVVKIPFSNIGRQHRMCKQNSFRRWLFFKRLHGTVINQMMCSLFTGLLTVRPQDCVCVAWWLIRQGGCWWKAITACPSLTLATAAMCRIQGVSRERKKKGVFTTPGDVYAIRLTGVSYPACATDVQQIALCAYRNTGLAR